MSIGHQKESTRFSCLAVFPLKPPTFACTRFNDQCNIKRAAEKIIAKAAGRDIVSPGEFVTCAVDLAMMHDSGGPRRVEPILKRLGAKVWDPDKVVLITDHFVPPVDAMSAAILDLKAALGS